MHLYRPASMLLLAGALSGCAATAYVPPSLLCSATTSAAPDTWWQQFGDNNLQAALHEARRCNIDLAQKALIVSRDRLQYEDDDITLAGSLSPKRMQTLDGRNENRSYTSSLSVSYELDLWGRLARARDSEHWQAQSSEFDRQATVISVEASTAQVYWEQAALTQRLVLARQTLADRQRMLNLAQQALALGMISASDVISEQTQVLQAGQDASQLELALNDSRAHFAKLLDLPPGTLPAISNLPMGALPQINPGLPVSLLARRPDVAAQEARLKSKLALIDKAQADFMPALTLTGELGSSSASLKQWMSQPYGAVMGSLAFPLLNWHNLSLKLKQVKIDYQIESLDYRRTLLQALREVDTALTRQQRLQQDEQRLQQELALARQSETDAAVRRQLGEADVVLLYQAGINRRSVEDRLISKRMEQLVNLATLYKAMGGAPQDANQQGSITGPD